MDTTILTVIIYYYPLPSLLIAYVDRQLVLQDITTNRPFLTSTSGEKFKLLLNIYKFYNNYNYLFNRLSVVTL